MMTEFIVKVILIAAFLGGLVFGDFSVELDLCFFIGIALLFVSLFDDDTASSAVNPKSNQH